MSALHVMFLSLLIVCLPFLSSRCSLLIITQRLDLPLCSRKARHKRTRRALQFHDRHSLRLGILGRSVATHEQRDGCPARLLCPPPARCGPSPATPDRVLHTSFLF